MQSLITPRHRAVRLAATGAALMTVLAGVSVATATTAGAASCSDWSPSANGEGEGILTKSVNNKKGPGEDCTSSGSLSTGTIVWLRCYAVNQYGNTWWYFRTDATSTYGWTSENNMKVYMYDDNGDGTWEPTRC
ncbi:hypothetical protein [Streptomyces sp. NPDC093018]|uniref:hypothetical protein n=1 Tax=Streptomyces sp. NPDC093018 TaxID=3155067 RepID=UPI0034259A66